MSRAQRSAEGSLRRITPEELDRVIARVLEDGLTEFVLIEPGIKLSRSPQHWPKELQGRDVYQLTHKRIDVGSQILRLVNIRTLILWNLAIGEGGAKAIASQLGQLTSLDLRGNGIRPEGAKAIASQLGQLTSLQLGYNEIGDEGAIAIASQLGHLTSLQLGYNQVGVRGAMAIASQLSRLTSLDLWNNQIGDEGARAISGQSSKLTSLQLGYNEIGDAGAKAIASQLGRLTSLQLGYNRVGVEGAKAIGNRLRNLRSLSLWNSQIGDEGAKAIASGLGQLTLLDLRENQVGDEAAKAIANQLGNLTSLDLGSNQIADKGAKAIASQLRQLTSLSFWSNRIGDEGAKAIAGRLGQLTALYLGSNQIGDEGVSAIGENLRGLSILDLSNNPGVHSVTTLSGLTSVQELDLSYTGVTDLSPLRPIVEAGCPIVWQAGGEGINVYECPLLQPTPEVVQQGREAVLNYFREIDRQGIDHLYEAKVLLVGEGGAGKTSVIRRLYYPDLPLPTEDESTRGIQVHVQQFMRDDGRPFRLNVWDFGGQQIYHATHQFFLTKSSLYVLVDDTRKDYKTVRDEGFKYWLEVVEAFGAGSPLLIFQNEKGGRSKTIDEAGIKGRFPNVLVTLRGNLAEAGSAEALRHEVEHQIQRLPHVGEAVPAKWVSIRADIERVAEKKPYISQDDYFGIYGRHLELDRQKALYLSRYLHDIGVFLHFQDDMRLQKTVIVQNRWATEAVFRILDDEQIKERKGRFTLEDCTRLWAASEYADMHAELLALMEKFELCYKLADTQRETWLAPQLLFPSAPEYAATWDAPDDLVLSYRYEFLPRGLVSRLMVRMNRFVTHPERSWANGAFFEHLGTQLVVRAEDSGVEITLRARGSESKELMSVIASALDALNDSFRGLQGKVRKWVPCICTQCLAATKPELFEEQHLIQRKQDNRLTIECRRSYQNVSVLELLDGLRLEHLPKWASDLQHAAKHDASIDVVRAAKQGAGESPAANVLKIFVASSEELRSDRDEFELYFRQQNDSLRKRGLYLQVVRWENFLDAMSDTRLQDDYNNAVRDADIFVSLFKTRTGKYTEEEFDVAYKAFKETGKPRIWTYFRDAQVSADAESLMALTTLVNFQNKLRELGHFYTKYSDAEHLKRLFRDQLEKLGTL